MIKFRNREVKDFITLLGMMSDVRTLETGKELRAACDAEFGENDSKIYLGFLIAYFKPAAKRAELGRLLGNIKHPLLPDCDQKEPEPELAIRIGLAQCRAWMRLLAFERDNDLTAVKFSDEDRTPRDAFEERKKNADWNF